MLRSRDLILSVEVTSLAALRMAGQEAALSSLYQQLTALVVKWGYQVVRLVLAGEDLVDSEDVILEVYVEGLPNEEARLDLWEALSAVVEDSASSPLLERLALVVHREIRVVRDKCELDSA